MKILRCSREMSGVLVVIAFCLTENSYAQPIELPTTDIAVLHYSGYETLHPAGGGPAIGVGDVFDGILRIERIQNMHGTVDLSPQLSSRELTGHFQFHVTAVGPPAHIEFAPDFFRFFVGTGATKNFDPAAVDAVARATDGSLWAEALPGTFFESVNDPFDGAPRNRAWLDVTRNVTGYDFAAVQFSTLLGKDPSHVYDGMVHGDHPVQAYFEDFPTPSDLAAYTFKIQGQIYLHPVPEPHTLMLMMSGLLILIRHVSRRKEGGDDQKPV